MPHVFPDFCYHRMVQYRCDLTDLTGKAFNSGAGVAFSRSRLHRFLQSRTIPHSFCFIFMILIFVKIIGQLFCTKPRNLFRLYLFGRKEYHRIDAVLSSNSIRWYTVLLVSLPVMLILIPLLKYCQGHHHPPLSM